MPRFISLYAAGTVILVSCFLFGGCARRAYPTDGRSWEAQPRALRVSDSGNGTSPARDAGQSGISPANRQSTVPQPGPGISEKSEKPPTRPIQVSRDKIDLGGRVPPAGASVLEYLESELASRENEENAAAPDIKKHKEPVKNPPERSEAKDHLTPGTTEPPRDSPADELRPPPDEDTAIRWLSSSWRKQAAACRFFINWPVERALKPLGKLALADSPASRLALQALLAAGGTDAAEYIYRAVLRSSIPDSRLYAAELLCFRMGAEADRFIPSIMIKGDYKIKLLAARAAGRRRLRDATPYLRRVMQNRSLPERLRLEAAGAMLHVEPENTEARTLFGRSLDRGGISALMALEVLSVTPGDWPARVLAGVLLAREERVAFTALSGLVLRPPEQGARALQQAFGPPADRHPRVLLAAGILNALEDPSAVLELLEEGSHSERHLGVRVAQFLRLERARPLLEEMAGRDPHPMIRAASSEALDVFIAGEEPDQKWVPRSASRAYLKPDGSLRGAFIVNEKGEETFFRPGDRLPDGSILEGFSGGALRIKKSDGREEAIPVLNTGGGGASPPQS